MTEGDGTMPLSHAPLNRALLVVSLATADPHRRARLSGLGLVPGSIVSVRQRRPAFVVQSDETLLALEAAVASEVMVREA